MAEYVKISETEKKYSEKNLLQSQMRVIESLKHLKEYKKLRRQELLLKIRLKNKIEDAQSEIKTLKKALPRTYNEPKPMSAHERQENLSLEQELNQIKSKLKGLQ